ncbi:MAG: hypothetical protein QNJ98_13380 [Planctomycetota bacterium]|nr:hypothetical protein [Planctomycetota bacterium]
MRALCTGLVMLLLSLAAFADPPAPKEPRPELGKVKWIRDHDAGFAKAKEQKKPVFLLFQEVPG